MFKKEIFAAAILAMSGVNAQKAKKWTRDFATIEIQGQADAAGAAESGGMIAVMQKINTVKNKVKPAKSWEAVYGLQPDSMYEMLIADDCDLGAATTTPLVFLTVIETNDAGIHGDLAQNLGTKEDLLTDWYGKALVFLGTEGVAACGTINQATGKQFKKMRKQINKLFERDENGDVVPIDDPNFIIDDDDIIPPDELPVTP